MPRIFRTRVLAPAGPLAASVVLAVTAGPQPAAGQEFVHSLPIRERVLENGLRVLVLNRPGDPRVAAKIFTRMGALNEVPGELGAAHFLEHLMFKGTPTLGTTDWPAERPIRERIDATERALIEEWNRARNDLRQRGVFHDYRHADGTPRLDSLRAELRRLEREAGRFRDHGAMMRWYQAFGGTRLTASTEQEYMKFDINLPVENVEVFFRVEADRMAHSVFREFDEERMILVEQRFGDLNRPTTPYFEAMNSTVGRVHPVFWPEGYLTDFDQYTRDYQERLYREYFVPNNTALVFVGGVTLEEMTALAERYFGWMERGPEPGRVKAVEPAPEAERRVIWRSTELPPRVEVRHLVPGVGHPDRPHFDVVARVAAAELEDALGSAGVAGRAGANFLVVHTRRFGVPASLNLEVVLAGEADLDRAEAILLGALDRLGRARLGEERILQARKELRTEWHRIERNADALAFEIGHFFTMDRWPTLETYLNARQATTAEDVRRLAARYFVPENRTTGIVRAPDAPEPPRAAGGAP